MEDRETIFEEQTNEALKAVTCVAIHSVLTSTTILTRCTLTLIYVKVTVATAIAKQTATEIGVDFVHTEGTVSAWL